MPRPARKARHRKPEKRDWLLIGLKAGAVVVALGVGAIFVVVLGDGPQPRPADADQRRPSVTTTVAPGSPPALPSISVPPVPVASTVLAGPAEPPPTTTTTTTTTGRPSKPGKKPGSRTPEAGQPCDVPGAWTFGAGLQPLTCRSAGPNDPLLWYPVY